MTIENSQFSPILRVVKPFAPPPEVKKNLIRFIPTPPTPKLPKPPLSKRKALIFPVLAYSLSNRKEQKSGLHVQKDKRKRLALMVKEILEKEGHEEKKGYHRYKKQLVKGRKLLDLILKVLVHKESYFPKFSNEVIDTQAAVDQLLKHFPKPKVLQAMESEEIDRFLYS